VTGTTLVQAGAGTLTISGSNSFTNTSVSAGTLANSGNLTSTVTNSATFTNSGSVTGNVGVNGGTVLNNAGGQVQGITTISAGDRVLTRRAVQSAGVMER
jgi:autotransporter-associated beta strand protein